MQRSIALLILSALAASRTSSLWAGQTGTEFFEKRIRPILVAHCYECHSTSAEQLKGGLRLDSRQRMFDGGDSGPAIVPGKPEEGELIRAVRYDPDGYEMPPTGMLDKRQISDLTKWVRMGAPWPADHQSEPESNESTSHPLMETDHWSFQPIVVSVPPKVRRPGWPENPIDAYVLARLEESKLSPSASADKRTWLRRVYFDLIGLPPSPEAIRAFVGDSSPEAGHRVVDYLLASPHYGERWGRHWLDLVRYAETAGNEFDYEIPYATGYRDYVVRALNQDLPYDRFVVEHLAGDLIADPRRHPIDGTNESILGTGFVWLGQAMQSPIDVLQEQYDTIENQIDVISKTFLGLTAACARCHDHKFDPISMQDYYALAGYLRSSRRQFAFIDPTEKQRTITRQLNDLDAAFRSRLVDEVNARFEPLVLSVADSLLRTTKRGTESTEFATKSRVEDRATTSALDDYIRRKALDDTHDILHPWAVLAQAETSEQFESRRQELLLANDLDDSTLCSSSTSVSFEDFGPDFVEHWNASGHEFRSPASGTMDLLLDGQSTFLNVHFVPAGRAHSGWGSRRYRSVIRSRTFTIEKPFIDYRMYRTASEPRVPKIDPGDLKEGQVHLIIDGFQLIRHPIYRGLSIDVAPDVAPRWYRQDVSKWIGHRAYIEITDEDSGFLCVDRIVFRDGDLPAEGINPQLHEILMHASVDSLAALANRYQMLFEGCLEGSARGPAEADCDNGQLAVLNWFLQNGPILFGKHPGRSHSEEECHPTDDEDIVQYLRTRRELESRIDPPLRGLSMVDGTSEEAHVLIRGNHERPGEVAHRRFFTALGGKRSDDSIVGSGRMQLAQGIIDSSNPLTARVIANRVWHHFFGRGIVPTPDDFGTMGQPPTHPRLLDFLANELVRGEWSLKRIHRLIATSRLYRMSSRVVSESQRVDPDNRLWHRMPVRRLEGEVIRDAMLSVSGRLDRQIGGEAVLPHLTPFMEGRGRPEKSGPLDGDGRRSIYISVRRNFLSPLFLVFDYPPPQSTIGRRAVSNVPAQALTMMNNPFIMEQSRVWAEKLMAEVSDTESRISRIHESAFTRMPTQVEMAAASRFLRNRSREYDRPDDPRAWADYCHVVFNTREFLFVR